MIEDFKLKKSLFNSIINEEAKTKYEASIKSLQFDWNFNLLGKPQFAKYEGFREPIYKNERQKWRMNSKPIRYDLKFGNPQVDKTLVGDKKKESPIEIFSFDGNFSDYKEDLQSILRKHSGFAISLESLNELFKPIEEKILEMYAEYKRFIPSQDFVI